MFWKKKKSPIFKISYIHLTLNANEIRAWLENQSEINADKNWIKEPDTKVISIDWIISDDIYFHRNANQFSHTIAGTLDLEGVGAVEWCVEGNYFIISLVCQQKIIFICPLNQIRELLSSGEIYYKNTVDEMNNGVLVNLDKPSEYCKIVMKTPWFHYGLIYRNNLASLDFSIPSISHFVEYK